MNLVGVRFAPAGMALLRMPRLGSVSRQFPSAGFLSRGLAAVTPLLLLLLLPLSLQCQDVASLRGTVRNAQDDHAPRRPRVLGKSLDRKGIGVVARRSSPQRSKPTGTRAGAGALRPAAVPRDG